MLGRRPEGGIQALARLALMGMGLDRSFGPCISARTMLDTTYCTFFIRTLFDAGDIYAKLPPPSTAGKLQLGKLVSHVTVFITPPEEGNLYFPVIGLK